MITDKHGNWLGDEKDILYTEEIFKNLDLSDSLDENGNWIGPQEKKKPTPTPKTVTEKIPKTDKKEKIAKK